MARRQGLFGMVLRPGGTYDSSPAIYRRVRSYTGLRPGGTSEYRRSCVKAEGSPLVKFRLKDTSLTRPSHRHYRSGSPKAAIQSGIVYVPAYSPRIALATEISIVPAGHTATATALAEASFGRAKLRTPYHGRSPLRSQSESLAVDKICRRIYKGKLCYEGRFVTEL
jgi:hypothetical protein